MIDRRKHSRKKPANNAALPRCALLIHAIELLLSVFYKKSHPDKLTYVKKWEREKITHLGLAAHPLSTPHLPAKDISFSSWDYEKISNFGLTTPRVVKRLQQTQHQPKEKLSDTDFTPKILPDQIKKKAQNPIAFKNDNSIDDFFKILGYE